MWRIVRLLFMSITIQLGRTEENTHNDYRKSLNMGYIVNRIGETQLSDAKAHMIFRLGLPKKDFSIPDWTLTEERTTQRVTRDRMCFGIKAEREKLDICDRMADLWFHVRSIREEAAIQLNQTVDAIQEKLNQCEDGQRTSSTVSWQTNAWAKILQIETEYEYKQVQQQVNKFKDSFEGVLNAFSVRQQKIVTLLHMHWKRMNVLSENFAQLRLCEQAARHVRQTL